MFQFLLANTDLWSTPDVKAMCVMGDSIIAIYDRPMDVVDLTVDEPGGEAGAADNGTENPNMPADAGNDYGLAEWSPFKTICNRKSW